MDAIDLTGYYGGLRQYIGELPETMIYSMVWKENMKKVNKEYKTRLFQVPYLDIDEESYLFKGAKQIFDNKQNKYIRVIDHERFFSLQTRCLENVSLTDLKEINSGEAAEAMQQTWNYDDLDKDDHHTDFISVNFGEQERPRYDPDDPYYANKYNSNIYSLGYNALMYRKYRELNIKIHKLPKRYRYSSGKDSMYGYKDCDCFLCWDRKNTFKNRIKEFEKIFKVVSTEK